MICKRCRERGQTWPGDAPRCAFPTGEGFTSDNWNCATMNELRGRAQPGAVWNDDQWAGVVPIPDRAEFIVLGWYKSRGATEAAYLLSESTVYPLQIEDAEAALGDKPTEAA